MRMQLAPRSREKRLPSRENREARTNCRLFTPCDRAGPPGTQVHNKRDMRVVNGWSTAVVGNANGWQSTE